MKRVVLMRTPGLPEWIWDAMAAGAFSSVHIPLVVFAVHLVPDLRFGYPLVLLPLLLAGPLATRGLGFGRSLIAAPLAGALSGAIAAVSLAIGSQVLGLWVWGLNSAASAPPMPPLPRVMLLPAELMTWAQQDVLFFQPVVALALSLAFLLLRRAGHPIGSRLERYLPRSLRGRLGLAFVSVMALALMVGWVGFSISEEMHLRGHRLQLQADWQRHLSDAAIELEAERLARALGQDPTSPVNGVDAIYAHLAQTPAHPGLSFSRGDMRAALAGYQSLLDAAMAAHAAWREQPGRPAAANDASIALGALRVRVDEHTTELLAGDDLIHHQRLILMMFALAVTAFLGAWLGERTIAAISRPIQSLSSHLLNVARGDFSVRVSGGGPQELARLGKAVNSMTEDLDRLYAAERSGRAAAEAVAAREHELAEAQEFWANTVVHDLKSPLTIISGYVELLEVGTLGSLAQRQRDAVAQIRRTTASLLGLAADINDNFRLQARALPLRQHAMLPGDLLKAAVQESIGVGRAALAVHEPLPQAPVLADVRLIGRVFRNLIDNAYEHAGPDVRVTLSASLVDGAVRFAVADDGPGIASSDRERVFERFARGSTGGPSSGLGLAFCRLVIEQHGGRIWAEEAPSGGAQICFSVPLAWQRAETAAQQPSIILVRAPVLAAPIGV